MSVTGKYSYLIETQGVVTMHTVVSKDTICAFLFTASLTTSNVDVSIFPNASGTSAVSQSFHIISLTGRLTPPPISVSLYQPCMHIYKNFVCMYIFKKAYAIVPAY